MEIRNPKRMDTSVESEGGSVQGEARNLTKCNCQSGGWRDSYRLGRVNNLQRMRLGRDAEYGTTDPSSPTFELGKEAM